MTTAFLSPATSPVIPAALILQCQEIIKKGSKSFRAASLIFNANDRAAASLLYSWCRYCDDVIDEASKDSKDSHDILNQKLTELRTQTKNAFEGIPQENPVFEAMRLISKRYKIPYYYAEELLEGMAMDVRKLSYENIDDLMLYCYRVAGVVGLMMAHIMGVASEEALKNASDMGSAMQLTNIARDVYDDADMGRVYLPLQWLREVNLDRRDIQSPLEAHRVAVVVRRLLAKAEELYRSGDAGIRHLKFRPACAVLGARNVYCEIGREVMNRREFAWSLRVWIPSWKKAWLLAKGIGRVTLSLPHRMLKPWKMVNINLIWRQA